MDLWIRSRSLAGHSGRKCKNFYQNRSRGFIMNRRELYKKYDVPAPRYTSYPTVPYWEGTLTSEVWIKSLEKYFSKSDSSWSMYLHIPFCETLCTFCGCNTSITK